MRFDGPRLPWARCIDVAATAAAAAAGTVVDIALLIGKQMRIAERACRL
jgi:hypothetical protein